MAAQNSIRLRAVLLGVLGGLLIAWATPYNNMLMRATLLGGGHFPLAPFFIMIWLTVLTAGLSWLTRRPPVFRGLELLVSWILMVLVSGIPYTGLVRTFLLNLTVPLHFATPGNRFREVLGPLLPDKLYPADNKAVEQLYDGIEGGITMGPLEVLSNAPLSAWVAPFLWWGVFIFLAYFVMICLTNLVARQWVENERVNFPLLRLPQLMTEYFDQNALKDFFTNRYFLIGLGLTCFLHLINGLNHFYPQIPQIPTFIFAGKYFSKYGLFSGFYKLRIYIYPAFIGFAFLTTRQISFSMWFFYLLGGLMFGVFDVMGLGLPSSALGVTFGPTLAMVEETQMIGAYGIFFLFLLWLGRGHIAFILRSAFSRGKVERSESEWMEVRTAFWGFVIGFGLLAGWCIYFGMNLLPAVVTVGMFLVITLVASRVITQGGLAYFTLTAAPIDGLLAIFGSKFFSSAGLLLAGVAQKVLFLDLRESLMPSLIHSAKISERVRNRRLLLIGVMAVIFLGVLVSFAAMLALCYKYGLRELELIWAQRTTMSVYENVKRLVDAPLGPQEWVITFAVIGGLVMTTLILCYRRFYWWPLHPIGYLVIYSTAMRYLWFNFLVGWAANQLCLRYGGINLYRKVRFLFFGLILGDFLMGGIWALVSMETGLTYQVLPD
ncbi:DUF6785 family protein [Desulfohalovibrio reitneri]|uniref:DUF6785 family protein n=1 Tax=Desulfohalovibrio reitneri TaxID=1307759 RepID=UPI0004A782B7|nr:DUF6785 family protein [Desulfohalovibrio reitneri]